MRKHMRSGARCRTLRNVITAKGIVPRDSYGTLRYEANPFGRFLVFVDWDEGKSVPVPSYELDVRRHDSAHAARRVVHFFARIGRAPAFLGS